MYWPLSVMTSFPGSLPMNTGEPTALVSGSIERIVLPSIAKDGTEVYSLSDTRSKTRPPLGWGICLTSSGATNALGAVGAAACGPSPAGLDKGANRSAQDSE